MNLIESLLTVIVLWVFMSGFIVNLDLILSFFEKFKNSKNITSENLNKFVTLIFMSLNNLIILSLFFGVGIILFKKGINYNEGHDYFTIFKAVGILMSSACLFSINIVNFWRQSSEMFLRRFSLISQVFAMVIFAFFSIEIFEQLWQFHIKP